MPDRKRDPIIHTPDDMNETNKTELANKIAEQSQKVANTYQHFEDSLARGVRWFSSFIDKVLFNRKYGKVVAFVLALLMFASVNYNSMSSIYTSTLTNAKEISGVPVSAKYNENTFELVGLPKTVDITITGDAGSVTNAANSNGVIVADLEGLTEGVHEVRLKGEGFGENVSVKISPSNVMLTLKKKATQQFDLTYDFTNMDKLDNVYSVGTPEFEYTKVNVRAAKDTLDSIAFVKALIDVSGQTAEFEQDAKLVAYDANGQPVIASIVPDTVHVKVPVTSPSKTVAIDVQVSGDVPDGKAIESITMDQETVTIYGPEMVLSTIDRVVVTLNASTISKDSTILRPIVLPTGVSSSNINQITMTIKLGEGVTRTIDDVKLHHQNNVNNYKSAPVEGQSTTTSVIVFGTQDNIDGITADDIEVYVDMKDARPGVQEFPLQVVQPGNGLVKYTLTESTYTMNVLGEKTDDTEENNASGVNDG